ncbi:hypothetical protein ABH941_006396 [Streptacidiphilus sp. EB103A]|jgi:hypothetical protein
MRGRAWQSAALLRRQPLVRGTRDVHRRGPGHLPRRRTGRRPGRHPQRPRLVRPHSRSPSACPSRSRRCVAATCSSYSTTGRGDGRPTRGTASRSAHRDHGRGEADAGSLWRRSAPPEPELRIRQPDRVLFGAAYSPGSTSRCNSALDKPRQGAYRVLTKAPSAHCHRAGQAGIPDRLLATGALPNVLDPYPDPPLPARLPGLQPTEVIRRTRSDDPAGPARPASCDAPTAGSPSPCTVRTS